MCVVIFVYVGMKVILDFVPNHTGNRHPWFMDSSASSTNDYSNYYIWSDCAKNNWVTMKNRLIN